VVAAAVLLLMVELVTTVLLEMKLEQEVVKAEQAYRMRLRAQQFNMVEVEKAVMPDRMILVLLALKT
jgi:hypothetical protein